MSSNKIVKEYWETFLLKQPRDSHYRNSSYIAEQWGDTPKLATELGLLIKGGSKRASCSTLWEVEAGSEVMPEIGQLTIVLDGENNPLCIIETVDVFIEKFNQVTEQFAFDEGEGEQTLESWRNIHWDYFTYTLKEIGKEPTEDMPIICERFKVIYSD